MEVKKLGNKDGYSVYRCNQVLYRTLSKSLADKSRSTLEVFGGNGWQELAACDAIADDEWVVFWIGAMLGGGPEETPRVQLVRPVQ